MASSNRHWPSMFKSKPCNNHHHHQWQHDINPSLISSSCHGSSVAGCEERTPEPKPRWNPKPEQIRILEAIFNLGMVNPPRDEIRKIRAQLQEYGQVGDANVFYWFQNRKPRSKLKLRNHQKDQNTKQKHQITTITAPSSSSSSSSDKSSPNSGSVNQTYSFHQPQNEFLNEPFYFPVQQATGGAGFTHGFGCFSEMMTNNGVQVPEQQLGPCTSLLLSEILNHGGSRKEHDEKLMQLQLSYTMTNVPTTHASPLPTATITVPSLNHHIQGVGESVAVEPGGASRSSSSTSSTVFINDVAFEV